MGTERDAINPNYYKVGKYQVIDLIEKFNLNFHLGNAVKYIIRAGQKDDAAQDLKKAHWYLHRHVVGQFDKWTGHWDSSFYQNFFSTTEMHKFNSALKDIVLEILRENTESALELLEKYINKAA